MLISVSKPLDFTIFLSSILCHVKIVLLNPSMGEGADRPKKIWQFELSYLDRSRLMITLTLKCWPTTLTTGLKALLNYQSTPS